eukprot:4217437-Prymnesium_polylepis.2
MDDDGDACNHLKPRVLGRAALDAVVGNQERVFRRNLLALIGGKGGGADQWEGEEADHLIEVESVVEGLVAQRPRGPWP